MIKTSDQTNADSFPAVLDENELGRAQGGGTDNEHKDWIIIQSMSSSLVTRTTEGGSTFKATRED